MPLLRLMRRVVEDASGRTGATRSWLSCNDEHDLAGPATPFQGRSGGSQPPTGDAGDDGRTGYRCTGSGVARPGDSVDRRLFSTDWVDGRHNQLPIMGRTMVQLQFHLEVAVEVVGGDEVLQRDGDRGVEPAGLGGAEHHAPSEALLGAMTARRSSPRPARAGVRS